MENAVFEKPDIRKLSKEGYSCADIHCHTRFSDGTSTVEGIAKKCRKMGIGVAVTDHNEIKGSIQMCRKKGILAIPGMEVTSSEGVHTLFYFYSPKELEEFHAKVIKPNHSENPYSDLKIGLADIIEKSRNFNCVISCAHPFGPAHTGIHRFIGKKWYSDVLRSIKFIEAINGSNLHSLNVKAVEWGKKAGKGFTGGSDSHELGSFGDVVTAVKGEDFLDSLKKGSLVVGKEGGIPILAMRTLLKFRMWARFPRFYIKKVAREIWMLP